MGTINSSMKAVQQAQSDLGHVDNLPPLGHDLVSFAEFLKQYYDGKKMYKKLGEITFFL